MGLGAAMRGTRACPIAAATSKTSGTAASVFEL